MKKLSIFILLLSGFLTATAISADAQPKIVEAKKNDRSNTIAVTVKNDSKESFDNVKVSVFAFAPGYHLFPENDPTVEFYYLQKIKSGETFDLPLFELKKDSLTDYLKAAWAKDAKTASVGANSSISVLLELPTIFQINKSVTDPDILKFQKLYQQFHWTDCQKVCHSFTLWAPTDSLTFAQSAFYIRLEYDSRARQSANDFYLPPPPKTKQSPGLKQPKLNGSK